jgi:hypothetical protein
MRSLTLTGPMNPGLSRTVEKCAKVPSSLPEPSTRLEDDPVPRLESGCKIEGSAVSDGLSELVEQVKQGQGMVEIGFGPSTSIEVRTHGPAPGKHAHVALPVDHFDKRPEDHDEKSRSVHMVLCRESLEEWEERLNELEGQRPAQRPSGLCGLLRRP